MSSEHRGQDDTMAHLFAISSELVACHSFCKLTQMMQCFVNVYHHRFLRGGYSKGRVECFQFKRLNETTSLAMIYSAAVKQRGHPDTPKNLAAPIKAQHVLGSRRRTYNYISFE